jgi:hypothetical protein
LIIDLCDRLKVPNEYRELAILTARHHASVHRAAEASGNCRCFPSPGALPRAAVGLRGGCSRPRGPRVTTLSAVRIPCPRPRCRGSCLSHRGRAS